MGRIKTQLTKRTTQKIFREHREYLKQDFQGNQDAVKELIPDASKKLRNIIAGYATRLVKSKQ